MKNIKLLLNQFCSYGQNIVSFPKSIQIQSPNHLNIAKLYQKVHHKALNTMRKRMVQFSWYITVIEDIHHLSRIRRCATLSVRTIHEHLHGRNLILIGYASTSDKLRSVDLFKKGIYDHFILYLKKYLSWSIAIC